MAADRALAAPGDPNSILVRHKKFLKQLERQKNVEREENFNALVERERKTKAFKDQAAKQREKIKGLKQAEGTRTAEEGMEPIMEDPVLSEKPQPLTAANLEAISSTGSAAKAPSAASKKGKKGGAAKPAWAQTEQQIEEAKEAEIDELLEFAYELDYEKYMEDYEVRQALAIIKDRVNELTQEPDWKEKVQTEMVAEEQAKR